MICSSNTNYCLFIKTIHALLEHDITMHQYVHWCHILDRDRSRPYIHQSEYASAIFSNERQFWVKWTLLEDTTNTNMQHIALHLRQRRGHYHEQLSWIQTLIENLNQIFSCSWFILASMVVIFVLMSNLEIHLLWQMFYIRTFVLVSGVMNWQLLCTFSQKVSNSDPEHLIQHAIKYILIHNEA